MRPISSDLRLFNETESSICRTHHISVLEDEEINIHKSRKFILLFNQTLLYSRLLSENLKIKIHQRADDVPRSVINSRVSLKGRTDSYKF